LNYDSLGVDPAWRRHRQTARIRHGVARGFSTRTAHGNGRPHVFAPGGPGRVTLGPTLLPTTTRDATHHQTGWGGPASPHANSFHSGEFRTRGHVPRTHKLICTRPMGRGCVTRGELAARPHNNNEGKTNKAFAARQEKGICSPTGKFSADAVNSFTARVRTGEWIRMAVGGIHRNPLKATASSGHMRRVPITTTTQTATLQQHHLLSRKQRQQTPKQRCPPVPHRPCHADLWSEARA
jgi:hypothetical protein